VNLGATLRLLPYDLEVMGLDPGNNLLLGDRPCIFNNPTLNWSGLLNNCG